MNDQEARRLADEYAETEREALRLFNEVRADLLDQLIDYLKKSGTSRIVGDRFTIDAHEEPFWYFANRATVVDILEEAGCLRLAFEPENANLAHILDRQDLPESTRQRLKELAERRITWDFSIAPTGECVSRRCSTQ